MEKANIKGNIGREGNGGNLDQENKELKELYGQPIIIIISWGWKDCHGLCVNKASFIRKNLGKKERKAKGEVDENSLKRDVCKLLENKIG